MHRLLFRPAAPPAVKSTEDDVILASILDTRWSLTDHEMRNLERDIVKIGEAFRNILPISKPPAHLEITQLCQKYGLTRRLGPNRHPMNVISINQILWQTRSRYKRKSPRIFQYNTTRHVSENSRNGCDTWQSLQIQPDRVKATTPATNDPKKVLLKATPALESETTTPATKDLEQVLLKVTKALESQTTTSPADLKNVILSTKLESDTSPATVEPEKVIIHRKGIKYRLLSRKQKGPHRRDVKAKGEKHSISRAAEKNPSIYKKGEGSNRLSDVTSQEDEGNLIPRNRPPSEITTPAARIRDEKKKLKVRWSLQDEIAKLFNPTLESAFCKWEEGVSCSISPCLKEDGDYLCTNVMEAWPDVRKTIGLGGPTDAGLYVRKMLMLRDSHSAGMIERCVVCSPGVLKFKLSGKWIAKSIHRMVKDGMDICAPKLSVERAILYFLSGNIAEEMHTGHLRSTVIGETLARIFEYSRVEVIRSFHEEDVIELKMMTELLIEKSPNVIVKDLSPRELEVLHMDSKKRFDKDAEFREWVQQLQSQGWDDRYRIAWAYISKISRERNQEVYERLGVHVKEVTTCFDPFDSNETLNLPMEVESEGDEAIFIEGRKFFVDLAALWHALNVVKADWILHVTDVGQRDHFELCISAAKRAGWIVNDRCPYPLSHVGVGPVQADIYGSLTLSTTVVNLLGEAKIRCKAVLLGQGKAYELTAEELEDTAEALGYDAVKYAVLKNNRLTKCTINIDEILNEKGNTVVYLHDTHAQVCSITTEYRRDIETLKNLKGEKVEELILKNNEERELGLHLLRFTEVLGEVCRVLMPHILCEYLYDLCKKFDSFYSCVSQVVGYDDETNTLLLCEATEQVMGECFHLLAITPIRKKILKPLRLGSELPKRLFFSDLTEQQLMDLFCKGPCFRFDICNIVLGHNVDCEVDDRSSNNELILFGIIRAETHISDPSHYGSFNLLNRNFDDPLVITKPGSLSPHDICYSSLSVSTFVNITAKLYGTTCKADVMESYSEYAKYYPPLESDDDDPDRLIKILQTGKLPTPEQDDKVYLSDDTFSLCDGNVFISFSEYFANRPNGGSGYSQLKGKDGHLNLYYVALKYAVEAALEVGFVATSKETKVVGRVMAYYGKNFYYDCCASERCLYNAMLFEIKQPSHIEPGKISLMRPALGVPAQYSLVIIAELQDFTSGDVILSGVCEFFVPVDGKSSFGFIKGDDCLLEIKVDWKLPI